MINQKEGVLMRINYLVDEAGITNLNGVLDLDNRKLILDYPSKINDSTIFTKIFKSDYKLIGKNNMIDFSVQTLDGDIYHLNNIAVSYNLDSHGLRNFRFSKFDYALSNSLISVEHLNLKSYCARHIIGMKTTTIIGHRPFNLKYENFEIEISRSKLNDQFGSSQSNILNINITSSDDKLDTYENFLDTYHLILDALTIILGNTPVYLETELSSKISTHKLHRDLIDKYKNKTEKHDKPITMLTSVTLSSILLENLSKFKESRLTLFNVFITHLNCLSYVELSLSGLLQTVEGLYKNTSMIEKHFKKKNYEIFKHLFECNTTKNLLNFDDRIETFVAATTNGICKMEPRHQFIQYMLDIRNFFTHYTEEKNSKLEGRTYLYIFYKVSLAIRILILEEFSGVVDLDTIQKTLFEIDKYAPDNGLHYDKGTIINC